MLLLPLTSLKQLYTKTKTRLTKPPIRISEGIRQGNEVVFKIDRDGVEDSLFYRCNTLQLSCGVDIPLLALLLQAMKRKRSILLDKPVSPVLLSNLNSYMDIYSNWYREFKKIPITSPTIALPEKKSSRRVAAFFTGGVDSYYTFLQHQDEITDLIYVHGFDLSLEDIALREQVSRLGNKVASDFGVRFIEIETNVKQLQKGWGNWGKHSHGLSLVSVARALSYSIDKIYIPSSASINDLFPWGTHPQTDYLLGDEKLTVVHDSVSLKRSEKTVCISDSDLALKTLRVCYKNTEGSYNCCECEKCLRTMTTLYAVNKLNKAITFPKPLDPALIKAIDLRWEVKRNMAKDNLELLAVNGLKNSAVYAAWQR